MAPHPVRSAVEVLRAGGLVAFPTETVYGLGADAANDDAVQRVFKVKGRPTDHPLILHIGDVALLDELARDIPDDARALAAACWPGPLTLVLRRTSRVSDIVTGGRDTVGLRVPNAPMALALLHEFGAALAAPSANRFGQLSPTTADDVRTELGDEVDLVLDGGACAVGVESTIIELIGPEPVLLRPGGLPLEDIECVIGRRVRSDDVGPARAPGMLAAHYAPRARVEIVADAHAAIARAHELAGKQVALLAAEPILGAPNHALLLEPAGPPPMYAHVLYARLRAADQAGAAVIVVVPPPAVGLGLAVRDRLARAAATR